MDDIEWACKWVGWGCSNGRIRDGSDPYDRSIPDLAEAVRVKWLALPTEKDWQPYHATLRKALLYGGPLAFIKAVREVVDDGR